MQNIFFNFNHKKLGELKVIIDLGQMDTDQILLQHSLADKYPTDDVKAFLFYLYENNISNSKLTDIISDLLSDKSIKNKHMAIDKINDIYSKKVSKGKEKSDEKISNFRLVITKENINRPMFIAEVSIKEIKDIRIANIDNNETIESYRGNGLQKIGFQYLEKFLQSISVSKITLEAVDLDSNEFNLQDVYKNLGFNKIGNTRYFQKDVDNINEFNL